MMRALGIIVVSLLFVACAEAPVGSAKRPFTIYFIPSVDSEQITHTADKVKNFLEKEVSKKLYGKEEGFYVKSAVPTSYIAVVEAFGTKKADFAAFTTFAYILAKDIKQYDVEAVFSIVRGKQEKTYKAQFIARANSGIRTIEDLKGKKFAFTDPASTSGFIVPAMFLKEKGIQLGETTFAQKHDNVVTMVYQGQVDGGATYYSEPETKIINGQKIIEIKDARSRVKTQFPDVEEKVRIIGFTQEIPNEPWVMRSHLFKDPEQNEKVKRAIRDALLAFAQTKEGQEMLQILSTANGLVPVTDDVYQGIRKVILEMNVDIEKLIAGKKG